MAIVSYPTLGPTLGAGLRERGTGLRLLRWRPGGSVDVRACADCNLWGSRDGWWLRRRYLGDGNQNGFAQHRRSELQGEGGLGMKEFSGVVTDIREESRVAGKQ